MTRSFIRPRRLGRRGQTTTIEGVLAAALLVGVVVVLMNGVVPVPGGADTASTGPDAGERASVSSDAATALRLSIDDRSLHRTVLNWDTSTDAFVGATSGGYYANRGDIPTAFTDHLDTAFHDNVVVNTRVVYTGSAGSIASERLLYQGEPGPGSVTGTETITMFDSDVVTGGVSSGEELSDVSSFYIPDADTGSHVYNVVRVEVTVWRPGT